jgi:hypothetical protein
MTDPFVQYGLLISSHIKTIRRSSMCQFCDLPKRSATDDRKKSAFSVVDPDSFGFFCHNAIQAAVRQSQQQRQAKSSRRVAVEFNSNVVDNTSDASRRNHDDPKASEGVDDESDDGT